MKKANEFIEKLGLDEETKKALDNDETNVEELVSKFTESFGSALLERKGKELKESAKREGQLATYSQVESKLLQEMQELAELNSDSYKDVQKGKFEKILTDAKAKIKEKLTQAKSDGAGKDALKLQEQLEEVNKQLKEYQQKVSTFDTDIETAKDAIRSEYFVKNELTKALSQVQNSSVPLDMIEAYVERIATIEAVKDEAGNRKLVIKDKSGNVFAKSKTANYTDLKEFIDEEIMKKKDLYKRSEGGGAPAPRAKSHVAQSNVAPGRIKPHPNFKPKF